ncbi:MAG: hypothetical protein LBI04_02245 [Treponema sp.]|jgi:hypothetical protein|nr:hypothetical protein [Treponema sp.]
MLETGNTSAESAGHWCSHQTSRQVWDARQVLRISGQGFREKLVPLTVRDFLWEIAKNWFDVEKEIYYFKDQQDNRVGI